MTPFEMFQRLMRMAAADRQFTDEEIEFLSLRASSWGITDQQFDKALREAAAGKADEVIPATPDEREKLLKNLLLMMAADGELKEVERRLFAEAAARMNIRPDQLNQMIDELI